MNEETIEAKEPIEVVTEETTPENESVETDVKDQEEETSPDESSEDSSDDSEKSEATEIEIGIAGEDEETEAKKKKGRGGVEKRINELGRKKAEETRRADIAEDKAAELQELLKLKGFAEEHGRDSKTKAPTAPVRPKPEDFDLFEEDPKYKTALDEYDDARVDARIAKRFDENHTETKKSESIAADMRKVAARKEEHYGTKVPEFVAKYSVKDYEDRESVCRVILGDKMADQIIKRCSNAHLLFMKWGKQPEELHDLVVLAKTDPDAALMELGALNKSVIIKNASKQKAAVDEDFDGNIISTDNGLQSKYDKALVDVQQGKKGAMQRVRDISDLARNKKIKLKV